MSLLTAIMATLQAHQIVVPTPPPPAPVINVTPPPPAPVVKPVDPVVDPPIVKPVDPQPKPVPPTPVILPPIINTGLMITDSKGLPIGNSVDAGMMFFVSSSPGITITAVPDPSTDIGEISDNKLVAVLHTPGKPLMIIVTGAGKPTFVMIQCNQGAQPPPPVVPVVNPTPQPQPQPVVTTGPVVISVIEDGEHRDPATSKLLGAFDFWQSFRKNGNKIIMYSGSPGKESPDSQAAADIAVLRSKGIIMPGIVIRNIATGTVVYAAELPMDKNAVATILHSYTGI